MEGHSLLYSVAGVGNTNNKTSQNKAKHTLPATHYGSRPAEWVSSEISHCDPGWLPAGGYPIANQSHNGDNKTDFTLGSNEECEGDMGNTGC